MGKELSRRDFLKGMAGLGAASAVTVLSGVPAAHAEEAEIKKTDRVVTELPIPEADPPAKTEYECDVLVIGGGFAGLNAAAAAADQGQSVVLIDKGRPGYSGLSPWPSSHRWADKEMGDDYDALRKCIQHGSEYLGNMDLYEVWLEESKTTYERLRDWGILDQYETAAESGYYNQSGDPTDCSGDYQGYHEKFIQHDRRMKFASVLRSKGIESIVLKHVPIGNSPSFVVVDRRRFQCPTCEHTQIQNLEFQDKEHRITTQLREYVEMLLSATFNLKDTAELTGVGINEVKDIDEARLKKLYTVDGVKLKKPETQATFLSIDEFKLHNGHQYATIIINLQNRHILWVERGKKKQVVYNFFEHVGDQWMKNVKAVACDMNSDFQEAFEERYPHIRVVFDHFHIVKNFNEKVISPIRIEEQKRLEAAGETAAARSLKRSKYILTATRKTLSKLDKEAEEGKTAHKGSTLFKEPPIYRKGGKVKRYEALIAENKLLFACDMVKTLLEDAYTTSGVLFVDRLTMGKKVHKIIKVCRETNDKNMEWFANLLETHYKGVIAYATYPISSGIIEGVNQRIKTVRRDGYGYPDDEYFFLKIIDASRNNYIDQRRKIKLKPYIRVKADDIRAQVA